ncbi:autotransporter outer membrane beta-barrel domain-containing protein [Pseudomonas sp. A-B-26]|uniref:autotransporter outer membrane beta-barrel domain-containing protein n=1 Tax=Pseudomonas sp. A-B-26 TaxID=2832406 RepID=UPI001CBB746A|nr:autotransporter outer membrane beta-barrel domain-containing protein [Pseudomonas sp. A-B-26]
MRDKASFLPEQATQWSWLITTLPVVFMSFATAAPVVGGNVTINGGTPESWNLSQNATLTVNGAQTLGIISDNSTLNVNSGSNTQQISVRNNSVVNLSGATVSGVSGLAAVLLSNSTGTIDNSTITGNSVGLQAVRNVSTQTGSNVAVTGSTISGVTGGVLASAFSKLGLVNSTVQGTAITSYGLRLLSGQATATGSNIIGGQNGVLINLDPNVVQPAALQLENTLVQGKTGSAILVNFANAGATTATITVSNSQLLAGNDTLLDVRGGANTSMTVNGSTLNGNIVTEQGSTTQLTLQNNSVLTGRLENVANTTINDSSQWVLVGDSQVNNLTLNGGTVVMGPADSFFQLNVTNLSGNGRFVMGTDFSTGQTDLLNVTGNATGTHELLISSSGVDPAAGEPIRVVHTAGGDAQFFIDKAVDLGAFSYSLAKNGDDWILDPTNRTVSPGARSVLALFNTALPSWYGELTSLRTRMGELRFNGGQSGGWIRAYGNKYNIADGSGVGYQQTQQGFTLGADAPLPVGDGQWLVGVMAGHSKSDLNLDAGTSGTVSSYYLGTYTTWLDAKSGYYFDGVLKANRFRNDAKVGLSDGARAQGNYDNTGFGGSVEFGRHIEFADGNFLEPFTQWSAVVIEGKDYSLDNDLQAEGDPTRSLLGKVGLTAGKNIAMEQGSVVQPYLRAAWAHEFAKNNEVQVNNNVFNNDLSGNRLELGAGVAVAMTKQLNMHADFDYSTGRNFEQPFGINIGFRYAW